MGLLEEEDQKRYLVTRSVELASSYFDEATQYLYFDEEDPYLESPRKISLFYNFAYVFALYRTKSRENIERGASILRRLLPFQIKVKEVVSVDFQSTYMHSQMFTIKERVFTFMSFFTSFTLYLKKFLINLLKKSLKKR